MFRIRVGNIEKYLKINILNNQIEQKKYLSKPLH